MFKYRFINLRVAITRTGIFVVVYTLVLGVPFWAGSKFLGRGLWILPVSIMAALATIGPFLYIFFEHMAADRLFRTQKNYQQRLKQASMGMTRIHNLKRLLNLITHIVTKTIKITYMAIYLYDEEKNKYLLRTSRNKERILLPEVNENAPLVSFLKQKHEPIVYEKIKRLMRDSGKEEYGSLEQGMRLLTASVVIPSFLDDKLIGLFVLGDKTEGDIYTDDDLNIFQVLVNQAALAIENARFYENAKEIQDRISQAEKMATIGTMADGLSHQLNNRFYALSLIAGDTIDTIKLTDTSKYDQEIKTLIKDVVYALERIQTNVIQGGDIVQGLLKYTRKGESGFESLDLNKIIDNTLEMVQFKVKLSDLDIARDFGDIPLIKGNMTQLEEVFFNFIDNAYDSINERRVTLEEKDYRGRIVVSARAKNPEIVEITVEDNGMGIRSEDARKIFTPFFTTKISARKGTGLGLYVIKRIITDTHKGKIDFESDYKIGTRFIIELPAAK